MDGGVIKKENNAHNWAHINLENVIESIRHLCYTVGEGMSQFVLQVNLTVYEKTKGGTHMVDTKRSSLRTKKKVKPFAMRVGGVRKTTPYGTVVHNRYGRISSDGHCTIPIIFSKGSELYITEFPSFDRRTAKPLTRDMLRDVESSKIRIDTRGMSRVQVASIVKAISEK